MNKYSFAIVAGAFISPSLFAQMVVSPSTSPTTFSTDLNQLVEQAYPKYSDTDVASRLMTVARTLQERPDRITVRTTAGIERLMGFTPSTTGGQERSTSAFYYRLDPLSGKAVAMHKNDAYTGMERERFQSIEPSVKANQVRFISTLGVPSDELMKVTFRKVLVQSLVEGSPDNSDGSPARVRRGFTLAYRGFGGFPIEGAFARVSAYDTTRIESFALSWPTFKLHPTLTTITLESPINIKRGILDRLTRSAPAGQSHSLFMGMVFRPAKTTDGKLVHLPAMKVVLTPKAKVTSTGDAQTDAGLELYANVLKNQPIIQNDDGSDENPSAGL